MNSWKSVFLSCTLAWMLALASSGCSGSDPRVAANPEEAFTKGKEAYEAGKYTRAIEHLQTVFDFGRAHQWAGDGQFMLAEAYTKDKQYLLAANAYDRFTQLYPGDPRIEEAEYGRAMSYYRLSPSYELDQRDTEKAINYLRLYISKYPKGTYATELGQKIDELQSKLALKLYESAKLYERQERYEPAALTYERVLDKYPTSNLADAALIGAMRSYLAFSDASVETKKAERLDKAIAAYNRLVQLFPNSNLLKDGEALYGEVIARKEALAQG